MKSSPVRLSCLITRFTLPVTALLILMVGLCLFVVAPLAAQEVSPADLADPEGKFLDLNGTQVYYVEYGSTDGPAVLLLHGFGGSTFTWRDTFKPLADAGFHVIAFDRPPFGLSSKGSDTDYSLSAQTELTAALMDILKIETAALVGHSAGGAVIASFALRYPERVEKLVFVAGAVGIYDDSENSSGSSPLSTVFSVDPDSLLAQFALRVLLTPERFTEILTSAYHNPEIVTPEVAQGYQRPLKLAGWEEGLLAYMRDSRDSANTLDVHRLANINAPTLIIWGEDDTWVPIQAGARLHELISNSLWITYPNVGHLAMEENTTQFNADLLHFLKS